MRYPVLRGCIVHDMVYGELDDTTTPGDPLAIITQELATQGATKTYSCQAIIFLPDKNGCGEVFVLIPDEIKDDVARIQEGARLAKAVMEKLKSDLDDKVSAN